MRLFISLLFGVFALTTISVAQEYDRFPSYSFQISAIDWDLKIEPTLDGFSATATYHLRSNRDNVQSVVFAQRDLLIESASLESDELPFVLTQDSVRITLRNPVSRGSEFKIALRYTAYPTYGFFMDPSALVWTSGMHGVAAGLLPIIDHPRVRFRMDVAITHPSIIQVITNGGYVSRTVMSVTEAKTVFRSRTPFTAASIRLAFGMMQSSEARVGSIPVRMYVGDNTRVADGGRGLLALATTEIQRMSSQLKNPFPYEGMNILVVSSSYGETWGDGAGFAVLFDDVGDLDNQLRLAIASQWLRHALQSTDAELRFALASYTRQLARLENPQIESTVAALSGLDKVTDLMGLLMHVQSGYSILSYPQADLEAIARHIPGLIWIDDVDEIRFSSGWSVNPLPGVPNFGYNDRKDAEMVASGGFYFRFERTENPEIINLTIDPFGQPKRGDYAMSLQEVYLNGSVSQMVRFTESGGEIKLNVDNGLLNVILAPQDGITFRVEKPLGYWLYQFRNSVSKADKIDAARALGAYASDQDLGLLIRDLERNEQDASVKASITLGMMESGVIDITPSAVMGLLNSADSNVRIAVLDMVQKQAEVVLDADYLRAMFSKPESTSDERRQIAKILSKLMLGPDFNAFIQSESKKPDGKELPTILLQSYFDDENIDAGIDLADVLIGREYTFVVRREALKLLDKHDSSSQRWAARLPRLASDQDPRVRMMAIDRVSRLDEQQGRTLLQDRSAKEADPRIQARIQTFRR
jgi:hypothetical protein